MKEYITLFFTGLIQVFFVAVNTYFITSRFWGGIFVCGFIISIIWSWNVKRIAFGSIKDRLVYSFGAASGSILGAYFSYLIVNLYK